MMGVCAARNM